MQFFSDINNYGFGGKINLSILPNGIKNENKQIYACFSLLFGLNIDDNAKIDPIKDFDGDAVKLIYFLGKYINKYIHTIYLNIEKDHSICEYLNGDFFKTIHLRRWKRLLRDNKFHMGWFPQDIEANTEINNRLTSSINNPLITKFYKTSDRLTMLNNSFVGDNNINANILERECIYESINHKGLTNSLNFKRRQDEKSANKTFENSRNLINIINSIYQHPTMAEYFGLIQNICIPIDKLGDYFTRASDFFVILWITENKDKRFQLVNEKSGAIPEQNIDNILDIIKVHAETINKKFYHGLPNYGLVTNNEIEYEFSNISYDNQLQNEKLVIDAVNETMKEGKSLIQLSSIKRKVTEGIYMFQTPKLKENTTNEFYLEDLNELEGNRLPIIGELFMKVQNMGVLGQAINVLENDDSGAQLFSLVRRKAVYNPKGILNCIEIEEEGWKQTRLAQDSGNTKGSFDPQTIFHWTGKNLAIVDTEKQAHTDQILTDFEKEQAGGIEGTFEDFNKKEESIIYNNGYSYLYKPIPKADTQLVDGRSYFFFIKQVLSNSYTFPIKSDCIYELSMVELLKLDKLHKFYFGTKSKNKIEPVLFTLNDDAINPPSFVASEVFVGTNNKTTESNSHIVVYDSKKINYRGIFPPIIDLQFAKYLGLLSWQKLEANSEAEYKESGKRMVKRTGEIIPERLPNNTSINYLPDTRGKKLVITPANWFTRWFLFKFNSNQQIFSSKDDYFDFIHPRNNFPNLKWNKFIITQEIIRNKYFSVDNDGFQELNISIGEGCQLKFYIQLQDNQNRKKMFLDEINFTNISDNLKAKGMLISEHNHPKYAKGEFQITSAVSKPSTPRIIEDMIIAERPTKLSDRNKVFYKFKLSNPFPYLQTLKQLQVVSNYKILNDSINCEPTRNQIETGVKNWKNGRGRNEELLINELPIEVFEQNITIIEPEVYKNNFGFSIKLTEAFIDELINIKKAGEKIVRYTLNDNSVIVNFNVGNAFNIYITYKGSDSFEVKCDNDIIAEIEKSGLLNLKVILSWQLTEQENNNFRYTELGLKILVKTEKAETFKIFLNKLPYSDVSERNLSLLPRFEQLLLRDDHLNADNLTFEFICNNEFFVYRTESKANFIKKSISLQAISRFQEYYPTLKKEDFLSEESTLVDLVLQNNNPPSLPVYQITPLIFYLEEKSSNSEIRKRSMQLMFEIDRPFQTGETFALVISENDKVSSSTCSIGRDLTTFHNDFTSDANRMGFTIDKFIWDDKTTPIYLSKYYEGHINNAETFKSIHLNNSNYKILPLIPYFEKQKNKWIAVLAFDQAKLNNLDEKYFSAYNPFIKIVAIKYTEKSTDFNFYSEFTQPKYINFLSERVVEVTVSKDIITPRHWQVNIKNSNQIKRNNDWRAKSVFVACIREKSSKGINGQIVKSVELIDNLTELKSKPKIFHRFKDYGKIYILFQPKKVLCVYEFETFDNSIIDLDNINWLTDNKARLIYAENFQ